MRTLSIVAAMLLVPALASAQSSLFGSDSDARSYAPAHPGWTTSADFVVRADELVATLDLRVENPDPERATYAASAASAALLKRFRDELGHDVELELQGATLTSQSRRKLSGDQPDTLEELFHATLHVPLPAGDVWARTTVLAKLQRVATAVVVESRDMKDGYAVIVGAPQPRVKNPERFRDELLKKIAARARELSLAISDKAHPLVPTACNVPGNVAQSGTTTEQVALTLQVTCQLEAVK